MPSSNTHTTEFGSPWAQGEVYKCVPFLSPLPGSLS